MFSDPKILLITKNGIQLYQDPKNPVQMDFAPDTVKNLEIIDQAKFAQALGQFFERNKPSTDKVILVLADSILFEKEIANAPQNVLAPQIQTFLDEVPIEEEKKAFFTIPQSEKQLTIATNKQFFELTQDVLTAQKIGILHAVPSTFYIAKISGTIDAATIQKIASDKNILKNVDFLSLPSTQNSTANAVNNTDMPAPAKGHKTLLAVLGILLIAFSAVLTLTAFGIIKNPFLNKAEIKPDSAQESQPNGISNENVPAEIASVPKENLKIQVLNGSATEGQASKIKKRLEALGFTNIETGNSQTTNNIQTTVSYSENVDESTKALLQSELETILLEVKVEGDSKINPDYDILIITGKDK